MLEIKKIKFREKYTEINIRQRMYKDRSFITILINCEFYPSLVGEALVSGVIEVKLDLEGIKSIDDLVGKNFEGDIGSVFMSVNNDGVFENQTVDNFSVNIIKRDGRDLEFELKADDCVLKTSGVLVSLYTTSSSRDVLGNYFDMSDFYDKPVIKEMGNSKVMKFFVKE